MIDININSKKLSLLFHIWAMKVASIADKMHIISAMLATFIHETTKKAFCCVNENSPF